MTKTACDSCRLCATVQLPELPAAPAPQPASADSSLSASGGSSASANASHLPNVYGGPSTLNQCVFGHPIQQGGIFGGGSSCWTGPLFGFSGVDGPTHITTQFVGWFVNGSYSVYIWTPEPRQLRLGFGEWDPTLDDVLIATNDVLLVQRNTSRIGVTWLDWRTIVGFVDGPLAAVALEELTHAPAAAGPPPAPGEPDPAVRQVFVSSTSELMLAECDASDPDQQWSGPGLSGTGAGVINHAAGGCLSFTGTDSGEHISKPMILPPNTGPFTAVVFFGVGNRKGVGPCATSTNWSYMSPHSKELSAIVAGSSARHCLDANGGKPGTNVALYKACHMLIAPDAKNQQWLVQGKHIVNAAAKQCLTLQNVDALALATTV